MLSSYQQILPPTSFTSIYLLIVLYTRHIYYYYLPFIDTKSSWLWFTGQVGSSLGFFEVETNNEMQQVRRSSSFARRKSIMRIFRQFSSEGGKDTEKNANQDGSNGIADNNQPPTQSGGGGGGRQQSGGRYEQTRGSAISFFRSRQTGGSTNWIKGVKELLVPKKGNETSSSNQHQYTGSIADDSDKDSSSPTRIFNSKKKFNNRGATGGGGKWSSAQDDGLEGGPNVFKSKSRRGSNRGDDTQEDAGSDRIRPESVPPNVMLQLFDAEALQHKIEDRMGIDVDGLDHGDEFIANVITECLKNEDGVYREVITSKELFDNIRIPVARPARSLLMAATPDIHEDPNSIGYKLGSTAWQVLSKNYYFSEAECKYMSHSVARLTNKIIADAENVTEEIDMIFHQDFRKGLTGIENEQRKKELMSDMPIEEYVQGKTDWQQSAVVDEDDLFDEDEK